MSIANRIQNLRKVKGISQEELADIIGVSRQAVSKWESEQSFPEIEKVIIMSNYFDVSTDYILKGIEMTQKSDANKHQIVGQILYIVSTVFVVYGLIFVLIEDRLLIMASKLQIDEEIWGGIIVQIIGIGVYFIAKNAMNSKAPFLITYLNIIIVLYVPVRILTFYVFTGYVFRGISLGHFAIYPVYLIVLLLTFIIIKVKIKLKKRSKVQ